MKLEIALFAFFLLFLGLACDPKKDDVKETPVVEKDAATEAPKAKAEPEEKEKAKADDKVAKDEKGKGAATKAEEPKEKTEGK